VHRWARSYLVTGRQRPTSSAEDSEFFLDVPDAYLLDWFREGLSLLVGSLSEATPQLSCWSFLPAPSPLEFWARRQAHETAVHCADAEAAAGLATEFPARFAADGIDELLYGFLSRPGGRLKTDPPVSLAILATDISQGWTVVIGPHHRSVSAEAGAADCVISGRASDLYLLLWNRANPARPVQVAGDTQVLQLWRDNATINWS
jgi:uncharacterized protein (TIGR03083 family)